MQKCCVVCATLRRTAREGREGGNLPNDGQGCVCVCEQKDDEKSKLMKEYAKQNKDSDMTLNTKKKEDFGVFQIFLHPACP